MAREFKIKVGWVGIPKTSCMLGDLVITPSWTSRVSIYILNIRGNMWQERHFRTQATEGKRPKTFVPMTNCNQWSSFKMGAMCTFYECFSKSTWRSTMTRCRDSLGHVWWKPLSLQWAQWRIKRKTLFWIAASIQISNNKAEFLILHRQCDSIKKNLMVNWTSTYA